MSSFLRKVRGKTQNIFLIETLVDNETRDKERNFVVMGSTGNIYKVTIKSIPECTCPDFKKRREKCKHIYFILIMVMKSTNEDQEEYNENELKTMFNNIPKITDNLIIDNENKKKYIQLRSELDEKSEKFEDEIKKKDTDDLCPICLDDLTDGNEIEYCKYSCGKPIHKLCFGMWCKKNTLKCVFCKADWDRPNVKYINLLA